MAGIAGKTLLLAATLTGLLTQSKNMHSNVIPALCVCASIILKLRNQKVNVVQTMISPVLKAGHATKQEGGLYIANNMIVSVNNTPLAVFNLHAEVARQHKQWCK